MQAKIILKIRDFFRKNKTKIIIGLIVFLVIIVINHILKNLKTVELPSTTYEPHSAIMDNSEVPKKLQTPIEELIEKYIGYCNNKNYQEAYNLLSDDCKRVLYPNIEEFKKYIDNIFDGKKVYYIQNYSNVDNTYIYSVNILDDILATGLTGKEDVEVYEEKFVIINNNGDLRLSVREYIGQNKIQNVYEDEYIKVSIEGMVQKYETQTYTVKITNRCEHTIVLADGTESREILLGLKQENRNLRNLPYKGVVLYAGESKTFDFEFTKFYDENEEAQTLIFNAVRVLKSYTGSSSTRKQELENAVKLYSFTMKLN